MTDERYGRDVLEGFRIPRGLAALPPQPVEPGLVVEDPASGFVGAVVRFAQGTVELEDRFGRVRAFPLGPGYLVDGARVELVRPASSGQSAGPERTASGSFAAEPAPARVARPSRLFVEGRQDAELVERVWGADLRVEGVVVEYLEGVDGLAAVLDDFGPGPGRRAGVLVDHLVPGSKETRIADAVRRGPHRAHVLVVGHPFVDVWQAVKPARLGIAAWPEVPREIEWKHGVCAALGWPHEDQADIARAWRTILSRVAGYADLEPALLGRVEQLIDFVTA